MLHTSIYTALYRPTCPATSGTRILVTSQPRPQSFKLLSLGLRRDCDTQSSERRRLRPIKNEDRQIMEDHFLENYR